MEGETVAAVLASLEEETSAACSSRRRLSWVEAKRGIGIGDGGGILGEFGCVEVVDGISGEILRAPVDWHGILLV